LTNKYYRQKSKKAATINKPNEKRPKPPALESKF